MATRGQELRRSERRGRHETGGESNGTREAGCYHSKAAAAHDHDDRVKQTTTPPNPEPASLAGGNKVTLDPGFHAAGDVSPGNPRWGFGPAGLLAAFIAFLPFLPMTVAGESLFFRDLGSQFYPARHYLIEGLRGGDLRLWNPLLHEGLPMVLLPFAYPLELLQLVLANEAGISLFIVLHVPLAAAGFFLLCRALAVAPVGAFLGSIVFAMGGFTLSTINLYHYLLAAAWAPFFVRAFLTATESGGRRRIGSAALFLALMISTTGLEVAMQTCIAAAWLAGLAPGPRLRRAAVVGTLGLATSAGLVVPFLLAVGATDRGTGFPAEIVLTHSMHPMSLLQTALAGLFGNIANLSGQWWGVNFFSTGFPYVLSLFIGPVVVGLAVCGIGASHPLRRRVLALGLVALVISLGKYTPLGEFLAQLPVLRGLRYPVKAFFTVQFCAGLLAAFSLSEVAAGNQRLIRRSAVVTGILGGGLLSLLFVSSFLPGIAVVSLASFLPANLHDKSLLVARFIASDAAASGALCCVAAAVLVRASRRPAQGPAAAVFVAALAAADLLRAGAGLNPSVNQSFYELSAEMSLEVEKIRRDAGRVFTCDIEASSAYWNARKLRGASIDAFTMATLQETLTSDTNVRHGIRTAMSIDRASLVPKGRAIEPELFACRDLAAIIPSLQNAGVTRVISLEPLLDRRLQIESERSPARIAPQVIRVYRLEGARPRFAPPAQIVRDSADELEFEIDMTTQGPVVVGEPYASGWSAQVNGVDQAIVRTDDGHRMVMLRAGRNHVLLSYRPPGLALGLGISLIGALGCLFLIVRGSESAEAAHEMLGTNG